MSISRIFIVAIVAAFVLVAGLAVYQGASVGQKAAPKTTEAQTIPDLVVPYKPNPCTYEMGLNYVDGKLHGTPSPGQLGVNYVDGKVHNREIPLFTPDNEPLCR